MNSPPGRAYRWWVLGIVMMGTFMAILDSSIVNVALPRMMSTFGVNRDQIEWVSTGFMLATAVSMPLVGWVLTRIGQKALYLGALGLFTFGSAVCAFAWSYDSLIAARIIQAVGAGGIQPAGMAIIAGLFEPHERGQALGIWGTGIMVGPALGPTLGGYLTDAFTWRTIFSVNLPFGILTLIVGTLLMHSEKDRVRARPPFDWFGYAFLSLALIGSLLALSKGQEKGWQSSYIVTCFACGIVGFVMFAAIESAIEHPLLDLKLLRIWNYSLSMIIAVFRSVGLFGGMFLLPIFLQTLSGYTTIQAGLWMMPGAVAIGLMMPLSGRLADRYSPRWLVTIGTAITGVSLFMYHSLDPLSSATVIIGPQLIRGVGLAFMMAPMMTAAINAVPPHQIAMASSFLNVAQRLGGSFGIALLNTYVTNAVTRHTIRIGEQIGSCSDAFHRFSIHASDIVALHTRGVTIKDAAAFNLLTAVNRHLHVSPTSEHARGLLQCLSPIMKKANVMGFDDGFVLGGIIVLIGVPLCALLKNQTAVKAPGPGRTT